MISISSHVLDTALGQPEALTDGDGRIRSLAPNADLRAGMYRVSFDTRAYLESTRQPVFYPRVDVCIVVESAEHYHVPLLLSPFGYSTYRGS
jgi:5-hydroxyisourate hydrolase